VAICDIAVVGAGPIGLEMAVGLKRAGLDYLHFDARQIGYTISWFPPQTRFFSSSERIAIAGVPLQTAEQMKATREEYLAYLRSVVEQFDLEVRTYEPVVGIRRGDGDEVVDVPHPLSPNGLKEYDFDVGDSPVIQIPGRTITVDVVHVRPKDDTKPRVVGAVFVEREASSIDRARHVVGEVALVGAALQQLGATLALALGHAPGDPAASGYALLFALSGGAALALGRAASRAAPSRAMGTTSRHSNRGMALRRATSTRSPFRRV